MRSIWKDAQRWVVAAGLGLLLIFVLWGGLPGAIGFALGRWSKHDATVAALVDTVRITDSVEVLKRDTVVIRQRRVDTVKVTSDSLDALVTIANDSAVTIHDTLTVIPPLVVADLRALRMTVATQDTLIRSLYAHDTTQQWRIQSRDKLIKELSQRHPFACGRKCGLVIGLTTGILLRKAAK